MIDAVLKRVLDIAYTASTVPIDTIKSENVNAALIVPAVESLMDDASMLKCTGSLRDYGATKHPVRSPIYVFSQILSS